MTIATLILIPGLLCDQALWRHQIEQLGVSVDCRVADITRHDRLESLARDVLAMAPPRFSLAGLSMGGYVALEIMRQAPKRVVRLCLLDTSARADTPDQKQRRTMLLSLSRSGQFRGVTPRLLPLLVHPDRLQDHDLTSEIMAMAERVGRDAFQRQQTAILNRIDSRSYLKDISCPVQLICGAQDALTPPEIMEEIKTMIPQSHLKIIDQCGHLSTLERPAEVSQLMQAWLEETSNLG
jgi:pimeloyl-ACP methyl ester carboxylesterase